jgi:hypothetical protein
MLLIRNTLQDAVVDEVIQPRLKTLREMPSRA